MACVSPGRAVVGFARPGRLSKGAVHEPLLGRLCAVDMPLFTGAHTISLMEVFVIPPMAVILGHALFFAIVD